MLGLCITLVRIHLFLPAQLRHKTSGWVGLHYVDASHRLVSIRAWNCGPVILKSLFFLHTIEIYIRILKYFQTFGYFKLYNIQNFSIFQDLYIYADSGRFIFSKGLEWSNP
jgi:hypothetical protein